MIKLTTPSFKHGLTLLMLLTLAGWARLRLTMLDFNSLLTSYLQDDAFYYFKIAANVSNLHRITYDGEQLSNGFHPLWLALITPFYTNGNDGIDFVYRVQWIMFACALLTVAALYFTLLRLRAGWFISAVITALFCVHSTFIDMQMNGLETSLNSLVLLLLFNAFLTIFLRPDCSMARYVYFGFAAAAAFLTRTDNGICLMFLFAMIFFDARDSFHENWKKIFMAWLVAFIVVLPWLAWNQINFGSFVQGSGKVETIYWGEPKFSLAKTVYSIALAPQRVSDAMQIFFSMYVFPQRVSAFLAGILFSIWFLSIARIFVNGSSSRHIKAVLFFCISVLCVFLYHAVMRSFVRVWYFVPVGVVFLLSLGAMAIYFRTRIEGYIIKGGKTGMAIGIPEFVIAVFLAVVIWGYSPGKLLASAYEISPHLVVAEWINRETPSDAVVGSMNSGILSYLVHRKVVNLDGVVDHRTMQALWKKTHLQYIHDRGVDYLVDNDGALAIYCAENNFHTCERLFSFGEQRNPSRVVRVVNKKISD